MMLRLLGLLLTCMVTVQSSPRTIVVTDDQCGKSFDIKEETTFLYNGAYLSFPCRLELETSDVLDDICVSATTYDTTCNVKVEYHNGFVIGSSPDKEVDCYSSNPTDEHCTSLSSLYVVLDKQTPSSSYSDSNIVLKAHRKSDSLISDIHEAVSVVVGVIIGIVVLLGIVTVVVIVVCCNRRKRNAAGMVYNNPQQMQTTVVTQGQQYPQGTVYPPQSFPQQPYYQPGNQTTNLQQQYPAPGNQPTGYGHPMTGFPPPADVQGTGYPAPPPPSYSKADAVVTAPPMSDGFNTNPPPYPGN